MFRSASRSGVARTRPPTGSVHVQFGPASKLEGATAVVEPERRASPFLPTQKGAVFELGDGDIGCFTIAVELVIIANMHIKASKEGITFSVRGDMGAGNVMLKPRESEKPEEKVTLTVQEPVTATFALRYLVAFSKAAPLCGVVELGLGADAPLLVRYDLEKADNGFMQFYLAPKIDE